MNFSPVMLEARAIRKAAAEDQIDRDIRRVEELRGIKHELTQSHQREARVRREADVKIRQELAIRTHLQARFDYVNGRDHG